MPAAIVALPPIVKAVRPPTTQDGALGNVPGKVSWQPLDSVPSVTVPRMTLEPAATVGDPVPQLDATMVGAVPVNKMGGVKV